MQQPANLSLNLLLNLFLNLFLVIRDGKSPYSEIRQIQITWGHS